ncbi:MAG TPA: tetraacyldisaccharide 4'-kinase, partial [Pyrinomonadaceae bacterium]|nr:tetraacyldisaccharide 4'-kinase [Pyrinomonadaceae bacterium]
VGGTGKTPLVGLVAEILDDSGEKVCVLTRGYGRYDADERVLVSDSKRVLVEAVVGGDEPVELARKLMGRSIVIADANRVEAAAWARNRFGITAFVLDDGFQHRRAKRGLDVVCIDATNPFGGSEVLPSGKLREPLKNLNRADAIIVTRADLAENIDGLKIEISNIAPHASIFTSTNKITKLTPLNKFRTEPPGAGHAAETDADSRNSGSYFAFCGLGNPESFFAALRNGFELSAVKAFRDHHFYSQDDIDVICRAAESAGADALLTTAKDAVKLKGLEFAVPCVVVEIEPVMDDISRFRDLICAVSWIS